MTTNYRRHFSSRVTPQSEAIPGKSMVQNNAGGFGFAVDRWERLARFLILGTEGGTYYVGEPTLTKDNAQSVVECIQEDGARVIRTVLEVSEAGRAPKNDPALFVLAMCAGMGDEATRSGAFEVLPKVARIGTHLLHFANFMEGFRGWGRGARRGVGNWFLAQPVDRLGYQFLKYPQRDGWSMRDLLRLAHPSTEDAARNALFKFIVSGEFSTEEGLLPPQVLVARSLSEDSRLQDVIQAITEFNLPREAIPNKFLNEVQVWEALLQKMPMTAMIRNIGKMTQVGLIKPLSEAAKLVVERLHNEEALHKARIHPVNVLAALFIYQKGGGFRGKLTWEPVQQVVDALDEAFYKSFDFVEPTNKRTLIGLDVSGSMSMFGSQVNGMPFLTAREASAAMCMTVARTEPNHHIMAFATKFMPAGVSPRQRLDDVIRTVSRLRMGGTDCSLPMVWALENKVPVDAFIVYTDNETWAGRMHPVQALAQYREKTGIPAKLIVNAMTSTGFSIADPNDAGMLDVVGLDSAAPAVMSDFIRK